METVAGYSIREQFLALQNWSTQNTGENEVKMFSAQRNGLFCVATFAPISSCINLSKVVALNVTRPILTSRLPVLIIRVYNSGLEGVLGSGGFDAEAIHGGVSSG